MRAFATLLFLGSAYSLPMESSLSLKPRSIEANLMVRANPAANVPAWANTQIGNKDTRGAALAGSWNLMSYQDQKTKMLGGLGWWRTPNGYSAILSYDRITKGTTFETPVGGAINDVMKMYNYNLFINAFNDDQLWWCNLLLDANENYQCGTCIQQVAKIWDQINRESVISAGGKVGIHRDAGINSTCVENMTGGVYWNNMKTDNNINSISTGLYLQVSARMYLLTKDEKYYRAAESAAGWIKKNTLDADTGLVLTDGINGQTCTRSNLKGMTYNTGVYIHGQMALSQAKGEVAHMQAAEKAAFSAMETNVWTDDEGRITEMKGTTLANAIHNDGIGFRAIMIRAMMRLYQATSNVDLKREMKGFVNVNYNMMFDKARKIEKYDINWWGPFTKPSEFGQLPAIDLLVAGMIVNQ